MIRTQGRFQDMLVVVLFIAAVSAAAAFRVWTRTLSVQRGYQVSALKAKNDRLEVRRAELAAEASTLKSPIRITRRAMELGLRSPSPRQIILMDVEQTTQTREQRGSLSAELAP